MSTRRATHSYLFALLFCLIVGALLMGSNALRGTSDAASRSPEQTLDAYHTALATKDAALAMSLLGRELQVYELGKVDRSRKDYAASHLQADMEAASGAPRDLQSRRSGGDAEQRWVISAYRQKAKDPDAKPAEYALTETAILQLRGDAWRIVHLHVSSDRYTPKKPPKQKPTSDDSKP